MGFFDGLSSSFQETTNKIQKESKMKKTINENKQKIEAAYSEIGKKVFEAKGVNAEVKKFAEEKVKEIEAMLKENADCEFEILKLNNKKLCPKCGKEVEINATFCPACGAEQEKIEVEEFVPKGKVKCSGCGQVIDEKAAFCPNCGTKKEEPKVEEPAKDEPKVEEPVKEEKKKKETKKEAEPEVVTAPEVKEEKYFCSECGTELEKGEAFCPNCGTKRE